MPKKVDLKSRLQDQLDRLYHNATPNYPSLESDYEQDLFNSWFEDHASFEIDDLNKFPHLERYGRLCQYGRGGRTLAPERLVESRGVGWRIKSVDDLDLSPTEARQLLKALTEFNDYVRSWNQDVSNAWNEAIELNEWQQTIEANRNKRRRTRTVYE